MDCGNALIATPAGGIMDVVTDCENGRLVSTNNAEELADTIDKLMLKNNQRERLAALLRSFPGVLGVISTSLNASLRG
jgi:glycosyltransferase involved in cell wall biosynthesis